MSKPNILERAIAFVSPQTALKRAEAAEILRKYAGAKNSHWSNFRGANTQSINSNISTSWGTLTARTRQLIRDFPAFDGAVNNMEAFIVGDGLRLQSLVLNRDGTPDRETSRLIEAKFAAWAESTDCDQTGVRTFVEMQQYVVRSKAECGDFIAAHSVNPDSKKFQLRAIDPATLTDSTWKNSDNSNGIWFGIEYDRQTLEKKAYHFASNADYGQMATQEVIRIPAEKIIHCYRSKGADQLRGVSSFASSLLLANAVGDFIQSELATQKAHAKWTAFVTTPGAGPGSGYNKAQWNEQNQKFQENLEYTTIEMLSPGQAVTLNSVQRSPDAVEKFVGVVLRLCAAPIGIPYEILAGDYRGMNFSSLNTVRRDMEVQLQPHWHSLISHFCRPVFELWLDTAVLNGEINIPGYAQDPARYRACTWIPPGIDPVDSVKQAKADILLMGAGLLDPQTIIMNQGRDPDHVLENIDMWKKELKKRDLSDIWEFQIPPAIKQVDEEPKEKNLKKDNPEDSDE